MNKEEKEELLWDFDILIKAWLDSDNDNISDLSKSLLSRLPLEQLSKELPNKSEEGKEDLYGSDIQGWAICDVNNLPNSRHLSAESRAEIEYAFRRGAIKAFKFSELSKEAKELPSWIDVNDRLPENETDVNVKYSDGSERESFFWKEDEGFDPYSDPIHLEVTHWNHSIKR